jgi:hypothetical protein
VNIDVNQPTQLNHPSRIPRGPRVEYAKVEHSLFGFSHCNVSLPEEFAAAAGGATMLRRAGRAGRIAV